MTRSRRRSYIDGLVAGRGLARVDELEQADALYLAAWARICAREGYPSRHERAYWLGVARGIRARAAARA